MELTERDIERLFERKLGDINDKNKVSQLENRLSQTEIENRQLRKEINELKYFVDNSELLSQINSIRCKC